MNIVLSSTSPYRKQILSKLNLNFVCDSPNIDEQPLPDELPIELVHRLSEQKALAVADRHPDGLIIGSDQVAVLGNTILGKPGNHENAVQQLQQLSGQTVEFVTGLCLHNAKTVYSQVTHDIFKVTFRDLDDNCIERYLKADKPYDCAGSFKSEGLGIALFTQMQGNDPNTLIGLPLITLISMLEKEGIQLP